MLSRRPRSGASVSARGESSLMRRSASREGSDKGGASSWAWFGGEDPDSDDAFRHDDGFDDGFVRSDALFDDGRNGSSSTPSRGGVGSNGAPVSPKTKSKSSSSSSKLASTRRWRLGAKAQILAAIVLSVVCTREVVRARARERARDGGEQDGRGEGVGGKMEKESVTIAAAKGRSWKTPSS